MGLRQLSNEETAVIRFFQSDDSLTVDVIKRNVGCGCGCTTEAIEKLDERGLIEVEDEWIELTDEGKWLLGNDEVLTRASSTSAD